MNSIEELSGINLIDTEDKSDCTTPICACQEKEPENEENYQYTELDKLFENIQKEVCPSQLSYKADWFRMFVESVLAERDFSHLYYIPDTENSYYSCITDFYYIAIKSNDFVLIHVVYCNCDTTIDVFDVADTKNYKVASSVVQRILLTNVENISDSVKAVSEERGIVLYDGIKLQSLIREWYKEIGEDSEILSHWTKIFDIPLLEPENKHKKGTVHEACSKECENPFTIDEEYQEKLEALVQPSVSVSAPAQQTTQHSFGKAVYAVLDVLKWLVLIPVLVIWEMWEDTRNKKSR